MLHWKDKVNLVIISFLKQKQKTHIHSPENFLSQACQPEIQPVKVCSSVPSFMHSYLFSLSFKCVPSTTSLSIPSPSTGLRPWVSNYNIILVVFSSQIKYLALSKEDFSFCCIVSYQIVNLFLAVSLRIFISPIFVSVIVLWSPKTHRVNSILKLDVGAGAVA